jgi:predicted transposase YdaD
MAEAGPPNPVDSSVKALFREVPEALFRLVGLAVDPQSVRLEDTGINPPEQRADHVFIVGAADDPERRALYVEYQLQPKSGDLPDWFYKCGGLGRQLGMPALLLVLYLEKGDRATFPDTYTVRLGSVSNHFQFAALRLWEHADRIRSGELWELAPLLVLCEDTPEERTVRREVEWITGSGSPPEVQADLLAIALRIAARDLSRGVLEAIFREGLPMVRGASIIDDWIAEGEARGRADGELHGRAEEARRFTLRLLRKRFGELPPALVARIEAADAEACEALAEAALEAESVAELPVQRA